MGSLYDPCDSGTVCEIAYSTCIRGSCQCMPGFSDRRGHCRPDSANYYTHLQFSLAIPPPIQMSIAPGAPSRSRKPRSARCTFTNVSRMRMVCPVVRRFLYFCPAEKISDKDDTDASGKKARKTKFSNDPNKALPAPTIKRVPPSHPTSLRKPRVFTLNGGVTDDGASSEWAADESVPELRVESSHPHPR